MRPHFQRGSFVLLLLFNGLFQVSFSQSSGCSGFRTQTQGGWGADPSGNNPAAYLASHFSSAFPNGLQIGCSNKLKLTSATAVKNFLPSGGTASALPSGTMTNPGSNYSNVLAGQLVAATLNIKFDLADASFGSSSEHLKDQVITSGPFAGWTVQEVVDEANNFIGGCGCSNSASALNTALTNINESYVDGVQANSYLGTGPQVSVTVTSGNCTNGFEATLGAALEGGTGPFEYQWSSGENTQNITVTTAETYSVTVTDANGCEASQSASAIIYDLELDMLVTNPSNGAGNNGTATAVPSGGASPYTFLWSTDGNTAQITGLVPGTYTVTVTDQNGCTATRSGTLSGLKG